MHFMLLLWLFFLQFLIPRFFLSLSFLTHITLCAAVLSFELELKTPINGWIEKLTRESLILWKKRNCYSYTTTTTKTLIKVFIRMSFKNSIFSTLMNFQLYSAGDIESWVWDGKHFSLFYFFSSFVAFCLSPSSSSLQLACSHEYSVYSKLLIRKHSKYYFASICLHHIYLYVNRANDINYIK